MKNKWLGMIVIVTLSSGCGSYYCRSLVDETKQKTKICKGKLDTAKGAIRAMQSCMGEPQTLEAQIPTKNHFGSFVGFYKDPASFQQISLGTPDRDRAVFVAKGCGSQYDTAVLTEAESDLCSTELTKLNEELEKSCSKN